MKIVAAGSDAPEVNQRWALREGYQFDVWTDTDHALGTAYGAWTGSGRYARITRLLDAQGNVVLEYDIGFGVGTHPQDVLDDCKKLYGPK